MRTQFRIKYKRACTVSFSNDCIRNLIYGIASCPCREKQEDIERIREELQAKGADLPPKKAKEAHFDSNCITPGQIGSAITIIYVSYKM